MYITLEQLMPGVRKLTREWHPLLARSFVRYTAARQESRQHKKSFRAEVEPHWILTPQWLMRKYRREGNADRRFLRDVLQGQFYAFLAIKIQDDLFDGQVQDRSLLYATDHLLLSAREAFTPYFSSRSPFWPFFHGSVRRTINAIMEWDHAQVHGFPSPGLTKSITSAGYAVCNIASFAVCVRLKKVALFQRLLRCTNELAFVGQLLDDLEDLQPDFQRGRTNYAIRFLLGKPLRRRADVGQHLARAILLEGTAGRFFGLLQQHLRRAFRVATALGMPDLATYIMHHQKTIESADLMLHRRRVQMLLRQ